MVTSFPLSKPVASAASPPPAGGPANPFLFLLRLFRLFRLGEPAAVVFRHCRVQTLRQNHFHGVTGFAHHLCCRLQFRFLHRPQHVLFTATERMVRPVAEPQPRKLLRAYGANHRPRAVVAPSAAVRMNANRAQGQLHFIPHHQQCVHIQFVLGEQLSYGVAAQVHVRLRLGQSYIFSGVHWYSGSGFPSPTMSRIASYPRAARARASFRNPNAYFFSFFSAFSGFSVFSALASAGSAPSSPSTSFLPFLMTSGSAGAAPSAGTASAGFSSSTLSATTCAITRSGSVSSLIFAGSIASSPTRNCLPSISSLTSMRNSVGMSLGRHSTSTSRVTTSKTPPCTFTPAGSPNVCTGTFTFMRTSIATRMRSTCRSFPVMGSTSQSFRMAGSGLPPNFT